MNRPHQEETPGTTGRAQTPEENRRDCGEPLASTPTPEKTKATLTARLALRGFALHELADGQFLVCRWDRTRTLPSLAAVQAFAAMVEGAR